LAQVVPATTLKIVTETMAVHPDLTPGRSPGRLEAVVEELPPDGIATIGQLAQRVAPVVVQLRTTEHLVVEPLFKTITAGLSRFGDIRAEIRLAPTGPKRVLVVEVLVALEKTRAITQEVGPVVRESVSTWVAEHSMLPVEVAVLLDMAPAV
jgi:hypothetical protein